VAGCELQNKHTNEHTNKQTRRIAIPPGGGNKTYYTKYETSQCKIFGNTPKFKKIKSEVRGSRNIGGEKIMER